MTGSVAVFTSTRADLFPLTPVLAALAAAPDLDVTLLASGTTANPDFGDPLADVDLGGVAVESIAADLGATDDSAIVEGGARICAGMGELLARRRPDALVVLGDRWELLFALAPAVALGVPIVHLHGGEVTEGAVDDRIRHAVTKLADLHCVSTERAAARLRQLGEPAERIIVTGAPSLDRLTSVARASDERLGELLGQPLQRPFALVTYHPPTATGTDPGEGAREVLAAVAGAVATAVITHPGLDRGRTAITDVIAELTRTEPGLVAVPTLGADYLPVLAAADVLVGNSSSGIIEAATFGVPVVDVGDRQRGRERDTNVCSAPEHRAEIEDAIRTCLTPEFRARAAAVVNRYGDGKAAPRIVDAIRRAVAGGLARKPFVDIEAVPQR